MNDYTVNADGEVFSYESGRCRLVRLGNYDLLSPGERKRKAVSLIYREIPAESRNSAEANLLFSVLALAILDLGVDLSVKWRRYEIPTYKNKTLLSAEYFFSTGAHKAWCNILGISDDRFRVILSLCGLSPWAQP